MFKIFSIVLSIVNFLTFFHTALYSGLLIEKKFLNNLRYDSSFYYLILSAISSALMVIVECLSYLLGDLENVLLYFSSQSIIRLLNL